MTPMAKIGRNDPCPCGSGRKYKQCCLQKDAAAERAVLAETRARLHAEHAEHLANIADLRADLLEEAYDLDADSNVVVDLVKAGKLDEAERAAHHLLQHYPEVIDGNDRLGMVYEARGMRREAAECYRQALTMLRAHPGDHDPEIETMYLEKLAELDPPADATSPDRQSR
jgi:tetratricopeptide (TPR) repeat protein